MLLGSLDNVFPERLVVVIGLYNQNNKLRAIFVSVLIDLFPDGRDESNDESSI